VNLDRVEKIAEAVLYEGYMLYPYRPSSVKNQQRWNFGVLCPQSYCERQQGSEAWTMQTECLVKADTSARLTVKIRFLQIVRRSVGRLHTVGQEESEGVEPEFDSVDRLEVSGRVHQPWEEAAEREYVFVALDPSALSSLSSLHFAFPDGKRFEYLRDEQRRAVGVLVREWEALTASVQFDSVLLHDGAFKITVLVRNLTSFEVMEGTAREDALAFSLVSAHTILGVEQGEFLSLLDPPAGFEDLVGQCSNIGTWPVLVGDQAETMLSSPIILYDHPQIAPESAGNLFDSTEIDEILSLRILTLTDDEKREMRQSDDRTREILERTENMPEEQFMKLHGVLRGLTTLKEEAR
jgi:hydrogenase maturation protease